MRVGDSGPSCASEVEARVVRRGGGLPSLMDVGAAAPDSVLRACRSNDGLECDGVFGVGDSAGDGFLFRV